MKETQTFSRKLRLVRKAFSISQEKLAEFLGVKRNYITMWESESYMPNPRLREKIADFFNINPFWLDGKKEHAFRGIVFIPRHFMLPQKKLGSILQRKIVTFICRDGAIPRIVILNNDLKPNALILFKRGNDLLLFLPFISSFDAPNRDILEHEIDNLIRSSFDESGTWPEEKNKLTHETYVIFSEELNKINPSNPPEEIEKILKLTLPQGLLEAWKKLSKKEADAKQPDKLMNQLEEKARDLGEGVYELFIAMKRAYEARKEAKENK